jgi:hypothetical protein
LKIIQFSKQVNKNGNRKKSVLWEAKKPGGQQYNMMLEQG